MSFFSRQTPAAVVVLALATIAATGLRPTPAARRQASQPTPLQLFQKMLPVVRHPRCMNCHGGLDPFDPRQHKADVVVTKDTDCDNCHDEVPAWRIPEDPEHFFTGKSDAELCGLFADFAMNMGHRFFISRHLEGDELIIAAFKGVMGGARTPGIGKPPDPPADPPPDDQAAFILLAQDWLTRGQGACEVLGTIHLEESVASLDTFHIAPTVDNMVRQDGTRTVTITLRGGKYYADIKTDFTITNSTVQHLTDRFGRKCTVDLTLVDHHSGTTTGLASVAIKDTTLHGDTRPPQTDYRIDVTLPPETGQTTKKHTVVNNCGVLVPEPDDDVQSFDWDSTTFVIEGHVDDPKTEGRAGSCAKMVKHGDVGSLRLHNLASVCNHFKNVGNSETPGLMERNTNIAFHDGKDIPFRVVVRWNLKFR